MPLIPACLLLPWIAAAETTSVTAAPGMIWDPDRPAVVMLAEPKVRRRGRVQVDELGLESIDPASGNVRWRTTAASVPLLTWRGMILALVESRTVSGMPLVLLDGRTGKLVRTLPVVPEGRAAGGRIGEAMSASFDLSATRSGDTAFLTWKNASWYVGGVPAPRDYHASGGTVAVDLATGGTLGVTGRVPFPEGSDNPYLLPTPGGIPYGIAPFDVDGVRCAIVFTGTWNGANALLRRTRDRDQLPDTILGPTKALYVNVWPAIDRRHLVRIEQLEDPAKPNLYRWTFFESATGNRIADLEFRGLMPRLLVHGTSFIAFMEGGIAAYDLTTGALRWGRASRNLRYHGSYPP